MMNLTVESKSLLAILFVAVMLTTGQCAEPGASGETNQDQVVRRWIRQLDADQFTQRQQAAEELANLGKDAVPAIEQAALTGNGEVASRSVDLLKGFAGSPEEETATLAFSSLKRLAASGNQTAGYLAKEAIDQLKRKLGPRRVIDKEDPLLPPVAMGNLERSVHISNVNGDRMIDVTQNGERIVARTMASGHVSVTWHLPGGKERTVEAANMDQLKAQDQQAFAKLRELTKIADAGPARFPGPGIRGPGPQFGVRAPNRRDGFNPFSRFDEQMEEVRVRHEQFLGEIEKTLGGSEQNRPAMRSSIEPAPNELDLLKQRMNEMLKRMERGNGAARPEASR